MREKAGIVLTSLAGGALIFWAIAVVVRWLRFALLHSLPVVAVILVCAAPAHAQGKVFTVSEWAVLAVRTRLMRQRPSAAWAVDGAAS